MDFDALGAASGGRAGPALGAPPTTRIVDAASLAALPTEDPRDALAALIAEPGTDRRVAEEAVPDLRSWLEAQPAVGVALLKDDPRPRRGTALALGVAGTDGRTIAADGPAAAEALRRLLVEVGVPLVGHEVKPLLVARGRAPASRSRRSPSTPRSRRT